ncbi:hypothetical protein BC826DRAFT_1111101 [Russula brevipes]|nr:hypothetical protein BC826DRAFT_1111101 [Russula brevipes]
MPSVPPPIRPLNRARRSSTYEWRRWWRRQRRPQCVGDERAPPPLGPPEKDEDDPMPSVPPHRSDPSTARAARPPTSGGGGGGGDGDDLGAWATNVRLHHSGPLKKRRRSHAVRPPTDPTPRPRAPLVHLRVAATARTSVHGRRTCQAEHLFCNVFPSSDADPPPTLDSDAELESLEMPAPSSPAASQVGSLFSDALSNLSSASSRSGSFSPLYFNHSLVISIRGMGGIHDNARPPPRRHPLALANAISGRLLKTMGSRLRRPPPHLSPARNALEASVPAIPSSPFDSSPPAMPQRTLLKPLPEPPLTAMPTPASPPLNPPLHKAQNTATASKSDTYHGRDATAKLCARFVSHLFTSSDVPLPLHRDTLPPVTPEPPLLKLLPEPPPSTASPHWVTLTCPRVLALHRRLCTSNSMPCPDTPVVTACRPNTDDLQVSIGDVGDSNIPDPPADSSMPQDTNPCKTEDPCTLSKPVTSITLKSNAATDALESSPARTTTTLPSTANFDIAQPQGLSRTAVPQAQESTPPPKLPTSTPLPCALTRLHAPAAQVHPDSILSDATARLHRNSSAA